MNSNVNDYNMSSVLMRVVKQYKIHLCIKLFLYVEASSLADPLVHILGVSYKIILIL